MNWLKIKILKILKKCKKCKEINLKTKTNNNINPKLITNILNYKSHQNRFGKFNRINNILYMKCIINKLIHEIIMQI